MPWLTPDHMIERNFDPPKEHCTWDLETGASYLWGIHDACGHDPNSWGCCWIKELLLDFKTTKALNKQLRLRCAHAVCWIKLGYKMTHTQATHHYPCPQPITSPGSPPLVLSGGAQRVVSPRDVEMHASMKKYRFIKYIVLLAGVCSCLRTKTII